MINPAKWTFKQAATSATAKWVTELPGYDAWHHAKDFDYAHASVTWAETLDRALHPELPNNVDLTRLKALIQRLFASSGLCEPCNPAALWRTYGYAPEVLESLPGWLCWNCSPLGEDRDYAWATVLKTYLPEEDPASLASVANKDTLHGISMGLAAAEVLLEGCNSVDEIHDKLAEMTPQKAAWVLARNAGKGRGL